MRWLPLVLVAALLLCVAGMGLVSRSGTHLSPPNFPPTVNATISGGVLTIDWGDSLCSGPN